MADKYERQSEIGFAEGLETLSSSTYGAGSELIGKDLLGAMPPDLKLAKPKLLLHSCCGPCSTAVIERLLGSFEIVVFFYNPNMDDEIEYKLRRDAQLEVIRRFNEMSGAINPVEFRPITFIEGRYDPHRFLDITEGYEDCPEGGDRCELCFGLRLAEAAKAAKACGCDYFATTLTVSPHKDYDLITKIGEEIAGEYGLSYLAEDFKKKAGFQRSIELSKKWELYRQNYCGCNFSKWFE